MAGLGCGNLAGAHVADRLPPRPCLLLFIAEIAIAVFGSSSCVIFYDLLYLRLGTCALSRGRGAMSSFSLLWPTFFMGVSLPLLGAR